MRYLFKFLIIILSILNFSACDENFIEEEQYSDHIIGKWKNTKYQYSIGGPPSWHEVENGNEIEFFEDGTFSFNRYNECTNGNYLIEDKTLILEYTCSNFSVESMNEDNLITFNIIDFHSKSIIISQNSGAICAESCSSKYEKI